MQRDKSTRKLCYRSPSRVCTSKKKRALAQLGYITAHSRHGTPLRAFPCPAEGTDHLHSEDEDSRRIGELGDGKEEKDENDSDHIHGG